MGSEGVVRTRKELEVGMLSKSTVKTLQSELDRARLKRISMKMVIEGLDATIAKLEEMLKQEPKE